MMATTNSSKYIGEYEKIIKCTSRRPAKGTSGGFTTTLLVNLMEAGQIDAAFVVDSEGTKSFYKEATTVEEIINCRGSKYQLLSPFPLLKNIDKNKKYAIVVLPCQVKKVREISKKNNNAIKLIIGLFCGFMLERKAPDRLVKSLGIEKADVKKIEYRGGKFPGGFKLQTHSGKTVFWPKKYYTLLNKMFAPKACLACPRFSAESADIAVGDAWEEVEYSRVILRNETALKYFEYAKKDLVVKESGFEDIYNTQWHLIQFKKRGVKVRRKVFNFREKYDKLPLYERLTSYFFVYEIFFFKKIRNLLLRMNFKTLFRINQLIRKIDFFIGKFNKKYMENSLKDEEKSGKEKNGSR